MDKYERGSEWRKWDLHLHTASSYDYKYKGKDADDLLIKSLRENNIAAVAITDHFIIDSDRIKHLRELAPDIIFFPGVELRTDTGANNLHVIAIFDCDCDVESLSNEFNVIMKGEKAKSKDNIEKIYWRFEDIVKFVKDRKGLLSIHAGSKSNGLEREIKNSSLPGQGIKEELAKNIDFYEVGKPKDIENYKKIVFKEVDQKPIIICSDNHDPQNYILKENLWIKADLTFNGLLQCIYQPDERVFVGIKPLKLDEVEQKSNNYIDKVTICQINNPQNKDKDWFNTKLELNSGIVAIIGNKGSGKSALSDIIALGGNSKNIKDASFLNKDRFNKNPNNYAQDYEVNIKWKDEHIDANRRLNYQVKENSLENVQYLPQKYIEKICNDLGNEFQDEINNVIFSYVDNSEKGDALNFNELIAFKTGQIKKEIDILQLKLKEINRKIIDNENKITQKYKNDLENNLQKRNQDLQRILKNKPKEVSKPQNGQNNKQYEAKLKEYNDKIDEIDSNIRKNETLLKEEKNKKDIFDSLNYTISEIEKRIDELNDKALEVASKLDIDTKDLIFKFTKPKVILSNKEKEIEDNIKKYHDTLDTSNQNSLITQKNNLKEKKEKLISSATAKEKEYQKYLDDLKAWENNKNEIIGNENEENSIKGLEKQLNYINNDLEKEYQENKNERMKIIEEIFNKKQKIINVYKTIYSPIESEIKKILNPVDGNINFTTNLCVVDENIGENLLNYISKSYSGKFSGKNEATQVMNRIIESTDFNKLEDVKKFIDSVLECVSEDIDSSSKKIKNKEGLYQLLCNLDYIGVTYNLKVGEASLQELSPGERGIVLLIFYLALSKEEIPIIIDQPEDNLDNQSVYNKLVPCICEAKKKRQVIIVTHNPNIAVACDAEQIIYCHLDKNLCKFSYKSGSIENDAIRESVINVLEGTMPAFDLRKRKYIGN